MASDRLDGAATSAGRRGDPLAADQVVPAPQRMRLDENDRCRENAGNRPGVDEERGTPRSR